LHTRSDQEGWFDRPALKKLAREHAASGGQSGILWRLLAVGVWLAGLHGET
jgi:hypothetical protein